MNPIQLCKHEPALFRAWLVLGCLTVLMALLPREVRDGRDDAMLNISLAWQTAFLVCHCAFGLYWLRVMRGNATADSKTPPYLPGQMRTWGYIWRYCVLFVAALILMVAFAYLVLGKPREPLSSIAAVWMNLCFLCSTLVACWLLFSKARVKQLSWLASRLFSMARGY
jgi:hypothetical protein